MNGHSKEVIKIVERSAFFYERIGNRFTPKEHNESEREEAQNRIARWRQQSARGDEDYFERRLAWDGIDRHIAEQISGGVQLSGDHSLPPWVEYLEGGLAGIAGIARQSLDQLEETTPFLSAANAPPFAHLFVSFVAYASSRLQDLSGPRWASLSQAAQVQLQQHLQRTLSEIAQRVLHLEFLAWLAVPEPGMAGNDGRNNGRSSYGRFMRHLWDGGLSHLFHEYPVLARFLGRAAEMWVSSSAEFLRHMDEDRRQLEATFNAGQPLGVISEIHSGLSDKHNGKCVLKVKFEAGLVCFYKPKDCRSEAEYNRLLIWLNQHTDLLPFKTYKVFNVTDHGWTEEVVARSCNSIDEVRRYYERGGMLLALLYALQASDCNYDNIICHGEHPVVVDTETLLQPKPREFESHPWKALEAANQAIYYDSVFRLCLLPRWIARPRGEKLDISGFGAGSMRRGYFERPIWRNTNTDRMALAWERIPVARDLLGVRLGSEAVNPGDYRDDIIQGFERMYRLLMSQSSRLSAAAGPLMMMTGIASRFIPRNTTTYAGILERCLHPTNLRDGMDTSIWVDSLVRAYSFAAAKPTIWPMIAVEHASLLDLNVPRFLAPTETDALQIGPQEYISGYFVEPGVALLRKRFESLSDQDLDLQTRYIRCAFEYVNLTRSTNHASPVPANEAPAVDVQLFVEHALQIGDKIRNKAIRGADGTANWITQAYNADSQFWQLQPMGLYLYDGVCGIALFLAALDNVTGRNDFCDLIHSVIKICSASAFYHSHRLAQDGIGAAIGTASISYSLARMAFLLGKEEALDAALTITRLITPQRIATDSRLDIIGGTAGCLLVLDFLYRLKPEPWILDRLVQCADHLMESRLPSPSGPQSWRTIKNQFLGGFSHGAAGIILSLVKAYEVAGKKEYLQAAAEAQEYEDSIYSEERKNWANLLLPDGKGGYGFWNSWCHGAPGIGLGRLGGLNCLDPKILHRDLDNAIATTAGPDLNDSDGPCCGNFGRIELLIEASLKLKRPDLLQRARELGMLTLQRSISNGEFAIGVKDGAFVPSFFQGTAGVGYQLLRLARPTEVSSVLCWE